ncbi:hypothetical protein OS493_035575 [Desmophyllum pertusum]|uniref:Methylmalonyl-CoA epimerase, mitochondrial n=1 Tax=Desmophyllum pertusum TaxID=174260 RepID=A0A9W9ZVS1_9CNID|nr:hypothetical protein OS493_035575 [Desmophyllum pertusum]
MASRLLRSVVVRAAVLPFSRRAVLDFPIRNGIKTSTIICQGAQEKLWKLGRLNHVAIAVPDLDQACKMYKNVLGADVSDVLDLPEHGVSTVFVNLGNSKLELLYPLGENSPIAGFLKKKADGGIHHICIEVDDIKAAMKDLQKHNIRALNPEPKIGAHGKPVVFLHPKDCGGVLVEMEEA